MSAKLYDYDHEKSRRELSGGSTAQSNFELEERKNASGESTRSSVAPGRRALISNLTSAYEKAREPGWDGDEATPIAYLTYYNGVRFIEQLPLEDLPAPEIIPDDDGYIEFEWYNNGRTFSFFIMPSEVVLYAAYYSRNDRFSGRFTFQDEIPNDLLLRIREVYSEKAASRPAAGEIFFQRQRHSS